VAARWRSPAAAAAARARPRRHAKQAVPSTTRRRQTLAGRVYVFGGGYLSELSHILSYDPALNAVVAGVEPGKRV